MPLSNYEKQKRWREKNRALYNFQQRQRRKNLIGGELGEGKPTGTSNHPSDEGQVSLPAQTSKEETLARLRRMVTEEQEKAPVEVPVKPMVYRSDYGAIISERQWNALQEKKRRAKEGGYEIDAYSQ